MPGFEVHHNGEKLCTAGINDFGVLSAILTWVSHNPRKLQRWADEGRHLPEATALELRVGGLVSGEGESGEHLNWVNSTISIGDEIRIRIIDGPNSDPPKTRYADDPAYVEEQRRSYLLSTAKELGWEVHAPEEEDLHS